MAKIKPEILCPISGKHLQRNKVHSNLLYAD